MHTGQSKAIHPAMSSINGRNTACSGRSAVSRSAQPRANVVQERTSALVCCKPDLADAAFAEHVLNIVKAFRRKEDLFRLGGHPTAFRASKGCSQIAPQRCKPAHNLIRMVCLVLQAAGCRLRHYRMSLRMLPGERQLVIKRLFVPRLHRQERNVRAVRAAYDLAGTGGRTRDPPAAAVQLLAVLGSRL